MCRLFGFKGKFPTKLSFFLVDASNSLAKQSVLDSRNICNNQGWGIGFYQYGKAYIQKRACCAYFDFNFRLLTDFVETNTMIAHVRDATVGDISDHNAHPFMYKNWVFAHNGTIVNFDKLKPGILNEIGITLANDIKGTTDSEFLFYLFITYLKKNIEDITIEEIPSNIIKKSLHETLCHVIDLGKSINNNEEHKLNVIVTNGHTMVASRYNNSLYYAVRKEALNNQVKLYKDRVNLNIELQCPDDNESIIVASEMLDIEDEWHEFKNGTILSIDDTLELNFMDL
ncbi:MAG: class II glutamine amidotransferase [Cyanobacteriota bacterium]